MSTSFEPAIDANNRYLSQQLLNKSRCLTSRRHRYREIAKLVAAWTQSSKNNSIGTRDIDEITRLHFTYINFLNLHQRISLKFLSLRKMKQNFRRDLFRRATQGIIRPKLESVTEMTDTNV